MKRPALFRTDANKGGRQWRTDRGVHSRAAQRWRPRRRASERLAFVSSAKAQAAPKNLRARAWFMARRVVLAPRERPARETGPQGVHADIDRTGRALAPARREGQPDDPHHRRRQRHQMGAADQCGLVWPLLCRLPGFGRTGADRFGGLLDRAFSTPFCRTMATASSRRAIHASPKPSGRRSRRSSSACRRCRPRSSRSMRPIAPGSTACARRSRSAPTRRSWC